MRVTTLLWKHGGLLCRFMEEAEQKQYLARVSGIRPFTGNEIKILKHLCLKGPKNILQLNRELGWSYPTAHRVSQKLLNRYRITYESSEKKRGEKSPIVMSLTPLGIIGAFVYNNLEKEIGTILEKWGGDVPLVIKYWMEYESNGVAVESKNILRLFFEEEVYFWRFLEGPINWTREDTFGMYSGLDVNILYRLLTHARWIGSDKIFRVVASKEEYKEVCKTLLPYLNILIDTIEKL